MLLWISNCLLTGEPLLWSVCLQTQWSNLCLLQTLSWKVGRFFSEVFFFISVSLNLINELTFHFNFIVVLCLTNDFELNVPALEQKSSIQLPIDTRLFWNRGTFRYAVHVVTPSKHCQMHFKHLLYYHYLFCVLGAVNVSHCFMYFRFWVVP